MKTIICSVVAVILGAVITADAVSEQVAVEVSPLFNVAIPEGYRDWRLVAPSIQAAPLDEIRSILGNDIAIESYRNKADRFPDGTVLIKLAWKKAALEHFASATIPGSATTVQVMVKDAALYPDTGGWGFGRFTDGKAADVGQHQSCFACHNAGASDRDYVFTRYAY